MQVGGREHVAIARADAELHLKRGLVALEGADQRVRVDEGHALGALEIASLDRALALLRHTGPDRRGQGLVGTDRKGLDVHDDLEDRLCDVGLDVIDALYAIDVHRVDRGARHGLEQHSAERGAQGVAEAALGETSVKSTGFGLSSSQTDTRVTPHLR